ncbi:MAG: hypothetical protein HKN43_03200 [Rhodothermales bacterium]|nr:hypothetical protein [Rhodothermales bacterium]
MNRRIFLTQSAIAAGSAATTNVVAGTGSDELDVYRDSIKSLDNVTAIQCSDGNWNHDAYMHGMANGLLLAQSFFKEVGQLEFKEMRGRYLSDIDLPEDTKEHS